MKRFGGLLIASFIACLSACVPPPTSRPEASDGQAKGLAAETTSAITVNVPVQLTKEWERTPGGNPKLESSVDQLVDAYQENGLAKARAFAKAHQIALENGRVQVVIVTASGAVADVRQEVVRLGGEYESHSRNLIQALVPLDALETLAQRSDVIMIREPRRASP